MAASPPMESPASPGHDPALLPFLRTDDADEAERLLADLLGRRARRTIRDVVGRVLHAHLPAGAAALGEDVEDVSSDALARVLRKLREMRADEGQEPIQSFDAYAARVATNACYEHFRRRHPARARLRNQVWYVVSRDPTLSLQRGANGNWLCTLAGERRDESANPDGGAARGGRPLPALIREVLARRDAAVDLNDLVDAVGETLGIHDAPHGGGARMAEAGSPIARVSAAPAPAVEQAEYLRRLWAEVRQLPLRQRTALLLNLRDAGGGDALDLLPLTGTASLREIAGTLALAAEDLARLWPDLPLDDRAIAIRLGVTRQQVINLRKAARARLSRRLAAENRQHW